MDDDSVAPDQDGTNDASVVDYDEMDVAEDSGQGVAGTNGAKVVGDDGAKVPTVKDDDGTEVPKDVDGIKHSEAPDEVGTNNSGVVDNNWIFVPKDIGQDVDSTNGAQVVDDDGTDVPKNVDGTKHAKFVDDDETEVPKNVDGTKHAKFVDNDEMDVPKDSDASDRNGTNDDGVIDEGGIDVPKDSGQNVAGTNGVKVVGDDGMEVPKVVDVDRTEVPRDVDGIKHAKFADDDRMDVPKDSEAPDRNGTNDAGVIDEGGIDVPKDSGQNVAGTNGVKVVGDDGMEVPKVVDVDGTEVPKDVDGIKHAKFADDDRMDVPKDSEAPGRNGTNDAGVADDDGMDSGQNVVGTSGAKVEDDDETEVPKDVHGIKLAEFVDNDRTDVPADSEQPDQNGAYDAEVVYKDGMGVPKDLDQNVAGTNGAKVVGDDGAEVSKDVHGVKHADVVDGNRMDVPKDSEAPDRNGSNDAGVVDEDGMGVPKDSGRNVADTNGAKVLDPRASAKVPEQPQQTETPFVSDGERQPESPKVSHGSSAPDKPNRDVFGHLDVSAASKCYSQDLPDQSKLDDVDLSVPDKEVVDGLNGPSQGVVGLNEKGLSDNGRNYPLKEKRSNFLVTVSVRFLPKDEAKDDGDSEVLLREDDLQVAESQPKMPMFSSGVSVTLSRFQRNMQDTMDKTVRVLEEKLRQMVADYGAKSELDQEVQCASFADHSDGGDCAAGRRPSVLCECGCAGPAGGAAPRLNDPSALSIKVVFSKSKRSDEVLPLSVRAHLLPVDRGGVHSTSDLFERVIRLPVMGRKCRCAKSMTNNKCAGFRADATIRARAPMQPGLLVDQDDDYAEEYLESLGQDQVGTQTDFDDLEKAEAKVREVKSRIDALADTKRCTCYGNVEMPWDLLTYSPQQQKEKKAKDQPKKRPRVSTIDPDALFLVTMHPVEDDLGSRTNVNESAAPKKSSSKEDAEETPNRPILRAPEETDKPKYYPAKKPPHQVFESDEDCAQYNEPYMEKLYRYFPEECSVNDSCPPQVEMPWNSIELPRNLQIRKMYKNPHSANCCKKARRKRPRREQILDGHDKKVSLSDMESMVSVKAPMNLCLKQKCKSISSAGSGFVGKEARSAPLIVPKGTSERMSKLLESCKREMEPIKQEINKLRTRIRELNLPDVQSEYPQRLGGSTAYTYVPSYMSLVSSNLDFPYAYPMHVPYWPPYYPNYIPPTCLPYYPPRTASKLSITRKTSIASFSTSASLDSAPRISVQTNTCKPPKTKKKPTASKIPVPLSRKSPRSASPLKRCGCKIKKTPTKSKELVDDSGCCSKSVATSKPSTNCVVNHGLLMDRFLEDVEKGSQVRPSSRSDREVIVKSKVVFDIGKLVNKYKKPTEEQGCSCSDLGGGFRV